MKNGNLVYNGRSLSLIGIGMSRLAYSDGNGNCVKVPVKNRESAGILQNRAEADMLKAGAGLGIFPNFYSISSDGTELVVEECGGIVKTGSFVEFDRYNKEILDEAGANRNDFGCATPLQRVAWGMNVFDSYANDMDILLHAEEALVKIGHGPHTNSKNGNLAIAGVIARRINQGCDDPWTRLVRFWLTHRNFVLQEMWHDGQWGVRQSTGEFLVIDMGFTKTVQSSEHYQRDRVLMPPDMAETGVPGRFCGKPLAEIVSPKGAGVAYNFKTSKGSEYVLAKDRMSQRVKKAGLPDDGLHKWMDRSVFVNYADLKAIMNEFRQNLAMQRPTRLIEAGKKWMALQTLDSSGRWRNSLCLSDAVRFPVKGRHICEFMFDGNNVVKCYHPGHDVTDITEVKC